MESLHVGPLACPGDGPVLGAAAGHRHSLVAVRVVDGGDEEHHRVHPRRVAAERDVPQHRLHRLFTLDLAGVDVGLDVDTQLARRAHRGSSGVSQAAGHRERQGAALERAAERREVDDRRGLVDRLQKGQDVVVAAGFAVVCPFGARAQRRQRLTLRCGRWPRRSQTQAERHRGRQLKLLW